MKVSNKIQHVFILFLSLFLLTCSKSGKKNEDLQKDMDESIEITGADIDAAETGNDSADIGIDIADFEISDPGIEADVNGVELIEEEAEKDTLEYSEKDLAETDSGETLPELMTEFSGKIGISEGTGIKAVKALTPFEISEIAKNGNFQIKGMKGGAQLVMVLDEDNDLILLGWLAQDKSEEIDLSTTAVVLLFFATGGYTIPSGMWNQVLPLYSELSKPVASALEACYKTDKKCLSNGSDSLKTALEYSVKSFWENRGILIEPSTAQSGITVLAADLDLGGNPVITTQTGKISFQNEYRRWAYTFLYKTAEKKLNQNEIEINPPQKVEPGKLIPPTAGANALLSSLGDWASGKVAYGPVYVGPLKLNYDKDTEKITYRLVAVGPGNKLPDFSMTAEEIEMTVVMNVAEYSFEVMLPILGSAIFDFSKTKPDDAFKLMVGLADLFATKAPSVLELIKSGDLWGALTACITLLATNGDFQEDFIKLFVKIGALLSKEAFEEGVKKAEKVLKVLKIVDLILLYQDLGWISWHMKNSKLGDQWTIKYLPPKIKIDPDTVKLKSSDEKVFTVSVKEGGDNLKNLKLEWSCTCDYGELTSELGEKNKFLSNENHLTATYKAKPQVTGADTIKVKVSQLKEGQGANYDELGEVQASVQVFIPVIEEKIIFDDNGKIYKIKPDGSDKTELTSGSQASLSFDASKIVFVYSDDIYMLNNAEPESESNPKIQLTKTATQEGSPSFSPDGQYVVFSYKSDPDKSRWDIYMLKSEEESESNKRIRLTNYEFPVDKPSAPWSYPEDTHPMFCKAGNKIIFEGVRVFEYWTNFFAANPVVCTLPLDTSNPAEGPGTIWTEPDIIYEPPFKEIQPSFSPDGLYVAASSDRWRTKPQDDLHFEIFIRLAGSGGYIRLTNSANYKYNPVFSPDGTKVLYSQHPNNNPYAGGTLYIIEISNGSTYILTAGNCHDWKG
jgi:hypothetical protein